MKTAISIPDDVFQAADRLAERAGLSRSALYTRAIEKYVAENDAREMTRRLDEVYSSESSALSAELVELQAASLPDEEW